MTFCNWVHVCGWCAFEIFREFLHVLERSQNSELVGWMHSGKNTLLHLFGSEHRAPSLSWRNPEKLVGGVVQAWKSLFSSVRLHVLLIRKISFLKSTVVRDVFTLRVDTVEVQAGVGFREVCVLIDDTLCFFNVSVCRWLSPPVN